MPTVYIDKDKDMVVDVQDFLTLAGHATGIEVVEMIREKLNHCLVLQKIIDDVDRCSDRPEDPEIELWETKEFIKLLVGLIN